MKKLFIIFFIILLVFPINSNADDITATVTFTQADYDQVNYWVLYWSDTSDGPYTVGNVQIDKTNLAPDQNEDVVVNYPANAITTYYFVLVAFKDADHYSANSNEASLEVDLIENPQVPSQFLIIIKPAP